MMTLIDIRFFCFGMFRGPGEEESSFPTRTVLITFPTPLESGVSVAELKSVFEQYGDIVVSCCE